MKSLIFCTSYVKSRDEWGKRYQKWIDYYTSIPFGKGKDIWLIDDGSDEECLQDFKGNRYNEGGPELNPSSPASYPDVNLFHFKERKGIEPADNDYGLGGSTLGWYRSFLFSYALARKENYDKIIHIESDAYLITQKICDYIDNIEDGWTALYCPQYWFPETSLQIICRDQYDTLGELFSMPLESFRMSQAEQILPITHVEQGFVGDRYGEFTKKQLPKIDYFNQCPLDTKLIFKN